MSDLLKKIKKICRVCLEEKLEMSSLSESRIVICSVTLSDMMRECASVKISDDDGLPVLICKSCVRRLVSAYRFKCDCERSDYTLRNCLENMDVDIDVKQEIQSENIELHPIDQNDPVSAIVKVEMKDGSDNEIINFSDEHTVDSENNYNERPSYYDEDFSVDFKNESEAVISQNTLECKRGEFLCPFCTKKFDLKSNMIAHIWQHHPSDKHPEEVEEEEEDEEEDEEEIENNKAEIKPQIKIETREEKVKTRHRKKCKKTHKNRSKVLKHICYVCSKGFKTIEELEDHKKEHPNQRYICDVETCEQQFDEYLVYAAHRKNDHSIEKYLSCPECERTFNSKKNLDSHLIRKHADDRPFGCLICSKTFREKWYLEAHIKTHVKRYKCEFCEKTFATSVRLTNHRRVHTKEKPFTCDICGTNFSQKSNLDKHVDSFHNGIKRNTGIKRSRKEKLHLCPHCGQTFGRPVDLTTHIRIHTGVKPFGCDQCEYRCHDKQLLKSHLRTHTGERPHKCSYCDKAFGTRSYLTIHERFHSGFRPYICSNETCRKGFTNSKDLKVHERTHTGIKLYTCTVCNNSFTTLHYLKVHTKKHGVV